MIEEDGRRRGQTEDRGRRKSGGIFRGFCRERCDCLGLYAIEIRDERIWIVDGWWMVAVCSAGICSKYGEKGCLSLSWKLNCFRWALMENRPAPYQVFQRNLCKESRESDGWFRINGLYDCCSRFVIFPLLTSLADVFEEIAILWKWIAKVFTLYFLKI